VYLYYLTGLLPYLKLEFGDYFCVDYPTRDYIEKLRREKKGYTK